MEMNSFVEVIICIVLFVVFIILWRLAIYLEDYGNYLKAKKESKKYRKMTFAEFRDKVIYSAGGPGL